MDDEFSQDKPNFEDANIKDGSPSPDSVTSVSSTLSCASDKSERSQILQEFKEESMEISIQKQKLTSKYEKTRQECYQEYFELQQTLQLYFNNHLQQIENKFNKKYSQLDNFQSEIDKQYKQITNLPSNENQLLHNFGEEYIKIINQIENYKFSKLNKSDIFPHNQQTNSPNQQHQSKQNKQTTSNEHNQNTKIIQSKYTQCKKRLSHTNCGKSSKNNVKKSLHKKHSSTQLSFNLRKHPKSIDLLKLSQSYSTDDISYDSVSFKDVRSMWNTKVDKDTKSIM